jgi:hypothetical protein
MYTCLKCNKQTKLFKQHLKRHHTIGLNSYFDIYPNEITVFKSFEESIKLHRQQSSPNSIEFYLKKGFNQIDAETELRKYRERLPSIGMQQKKSDISYWINKGCSKEEAIIKMKEYFENTNEQRILNKMFKENISREEAIERTKNSNINSSPRRKEYWLNKGFNEEEAIIKISEFQSSNSPRSEIYWINKGYAQEIAKIKVSEFQDFSSLTYITFKYKCSEEDAFIIQNEIKQRELHTKQERGLLVDFSIHDDFENYRKAVNKETEKNYRKFKNIINPFGYNRGRDAFHLDHIYSVLHGFLNNVDISIISSPENLRLVLSNMNLTKNSKSDISLEDLKEKINKNNNSNYEQ